MTESTDIRELFAQALAQTGSIVAAVRAEQLAGPTPCPAFDVRQLLGHLIDTVDEAAHLGETGEARTTELRQEPLADDGWTVRYQDAAKRARAAWTDDTRLDTMIALPWGPGGTAVEWTGRAALAGCFQEILVHGWDLAKATGQPTELDPHLGEVALATAQQFVPEQQRGDFSVFGPVVPVPDGSGPYARLAAWLGRQP
ncbi:MAG: hypothetical protein QG622_903 [Actinomycetota bacterium]|nr:hypothetical protein [Actinomycetota bacterium]